MGAIAGIKGVQTKLARLSVVVEEVMLLLDSRQPLPVEAPYAWVHANPVGAIVDHALLLATVSDQDRERGYYRVMAGRGSMYAEQCRAEGFIGADFGIDDSLDGKLTEELRDFNKAMIPIFLANRPDKIGRAHV